MTAEDYAVLAVGGGGAGVGDVVEVADVRDCGGNVEGEGVFGWGRGRVRRGSRGSDGFSGVEENVLVQYSFQKPGWWEAPWPRRERL